MNTTLRLLTYALLVASSLCAGHDKDRYGSPFESKKYSKQKKDSSSVMQIKEKSKNKRTPQQEIHRIHYKLAELDAACCVAKMFLTAREELMADLQACILTATETEFNTQHEQTGDTLLHELMYLVYRPHANVEKVKKPLITPKELTELYTAALELGADPAIHNNKNVSPDEMYKNLVGTTSREHLDLGMNPCSAVEDETAAYRLEQLIATTDSQDDGHCINLLLTSGKILKDAQRNPCSFARVATVVTKAQLPSTLTKDLKNQIAGLTPSVVSSKETALPRAIAILSHIAPEETESERAQSLARVRIAVKSRDRRAPDSTSLGSTHSAMKFHESDEITTPVGLTLQIKGISNETSPRARL